MTYTYAKMIPALSVVLLSGLTLAISLTLAVNSIGYTANQQSELEAKTEWLEQCRDFILSIPYSPTRSSSILSSHTSKQTATSRQQLKELLASAPNSRSLRKLVIALYSLQEAWDTQEEDLRLGTSQQVGTTLCTRSAEAQVFQEFFRIQSPAPHNAKSTNHLSTALSLALFAALGLIGYSRWRCLQRQKELSAFLSELAITCKLGPRNGEQSPDIQQINLCLKAISDKVKEHELQSNAAMRSKSDFLAHMSHEVRTPLSAIIGYAEVLKELSSSREQHEAIEAIRRNGDYLLGIMNDILELSRIDAGRLELEQNLFSPVQILGELQRMMRVRADAKALTLSVEFSGKQPSRIKSDSRRWKQALVNLIANAIQFTEVGSIRIICKTVEGPAGYQLLVDVVDTGIGMTPEKIKEIFDPFTQGKPYIERTMTGAGLGLTISQKGAKALNGDLVVIKSERGLGTRIRLSICCGLTQLEWLDDPLAELDRTPTKELESTEKLPAGCRVLVAEDGPDNQRLFKVILTKQGADVTIVENGKLAVEAALAAEQGSEPFDIVLMDMQMPVMDGYTATRELIASGFTKPIVAVTAHALATDRKRCLDAGCIDFQTKPIRRPALIAAMLKHLPKESIAQAG